MANFAVHSSVSESLRDFSLLKIKDLLRKHCYTLFSYLHIMFIHLVDFQVIVFGIVEESTLNAVRITWLDQVTREKDGFETEADRERGRRGESFNKAYIADIVAFTLPVSVTETYEVI